jgi:glycine dehydrogenase subunit 1
VAYLLNTPDDKKEMLKSIGVSSIDDLFSTIPESVRLKRPLNVPEALTEIELTRHVERLANANISADGAVCYLGGGSYDHFIPAVVDTVSSRSEFYTAYTPYQAEASQGSLQAFYEFQTMISQLTAMDISNSSLYEAGSGLAEAILMAMSVTGRMGKVLVAESVHPEYRLSFTTYLANLEPSVETVACPSGKMCLEDLAGKLDETVSCVIVQHPNFFGNLEEVEEISKLVHSKGALFIVTYDPISLGVLKKPGEYDADIAVAEGQCLGNPMIYGGPYLGLLSCKEAFVRKIPGRLVGQTVDRNGKRCWVLTLQTREQHIRREKATSNICTNQGLFALRASVYLAALGPKGLTETAELCFRKAHFLMDLLCKIPGVKPKFNQQFFKEFTIELPCAAQPVINALVKDRILAGLCQGRWFKEMANVMTIAVTEKRTRSELENYAALFGAAVKAVQGKQ